MMTAQVRTKLVWNGGKAIDAVLDAGYDGLLVGAELVLTETNKVVPLDMAILEHSGVATADRDSMTAAVSYNTPYAVRQHEDLTFRHPGGRKAKYLELTAAEVGPDAAKVVATYVRRRLRSGTTP
jgi:hypothetical protein